jgi:hypothetical protein
VSTTTIDVDPNATDGDGLFDAEPFTRPIPKLDGHVADRLGIGFTGSVKLDRLLEDNLQYIEGLRLGQDVTITIEATVAAKGFTHATKGDDNEEVGYNVKLKVHSITGLPNAPTEEDATE